MIENEVSFSPTSVDAFSLFTSIINDNDETNEKETNNDICLISNVSLDNTKTTLPCGHSFNYIHLLNCLINYKSTHGRYTQSICPYCREVIKGCIPYRPDVSNVKYKSINTPISKCYLINECSKPGCDKNATIPHQNGFACTLHYRKYKKQDEKQTNKTQNQTIPENTIMLNTNTCQTILKSGKRKGQHCGAKIKQPSSSFCKRHSPNN